MVLSLLKQFSIQDGSLLNENRFQLFYPVEYQKSVYSLDFAAIRHKKNRLNVHHQSFAFDWISRNANGILSPFYCLLRSTVIQKTEKLLWADVRYHASFPPLCCPLLQQWLDKRVTLERPIYGWPTLTCPEADMSCQVRKSRLRKKLADVFEDNLVWYGKAFSRSTSSLLYLQDWLFLARAVVEEKGFPKSLYLSLVHRRSGRKTVLKSTILMTTIIVFKLQKSFLSWWRYFVQCWNSPFGEKKRKKKRVATRKGDTYNNDCTKRYSKVVLRLPVQDFPRIMWELGLHWLRLCLLL